LFYQQASTDHYPSEIMRILTKNYRNAPNVTAIANKILKIKNLRFGSIDKESHYLVDSHSVTPGEVYCLLENPAIRDEINAKMSVIMVFDGQMFTIIDGYIGNKLTSAALSPLCLLMEHTKQCHGYHRL
jgi:hypothetical protein